MYIRRNSFIKFMIYTVVEVKCIVCVFGGLLYIQCHVAISSFDNKVM